MEYQDRTFAFRKPEPASDVELLTSPLLKIKLPQVQVALDMDADVKTICDVAVKAYAGGAQVIEAGTPAIKRHGTDSLVPAIKKAISNYCKVKGVHDESVILADLKTMDVGNLEARIAFRSGADVVNVLGIGSIHKVREALSEAIRNDRAICIDLMQCDDPILKMEELAKKFKGFEDWVMFCVHRGISEQLKGRGIYEARTLIEEARKASGRFLLSIAGGIKEGTAGGVASAGADICVVGKAIYSSTDPEGTTRRILKEVRQGYKTRVRP
jgi:3-keto-L-gulonate-6-phosphate decarboxylase